MDGERPSQGHQGTPPVLHIARGFLLFVGMKGAAAVGRPPIFKGCGHPRLLHSGSDSYCFDLRCIGKSLASRRTVPTCLMAPVSSSGGAPSVLSSDFTIKQSDPDSSGTGCFGATTRVTLHGLSTRGVTAKDPEQNANNDCGVKFQRPAPRIWPTRLHTLCGTARRVVCPRSFWPS